MFIISKKMEIIYNLENNFIKFIILLHEFDYFPLYSEYNNF